jgi:hypothetical protein
MKGFAKSNAIHVVRTRPADQIACDIVAPEKQVENGGVDLLGAVQFSWALEPACQEMKARYMCG